MLGIEPELWPISSFLAETFRIVLAEDLQVFFPIEFFVVKDFFFIRIEYLPAFSVVGLNPQPCVCYPRATAIFTSLFAFYIWRKQGLTELPRLSLNLLSSLELVISPSGAPSKTEIIGLRQAWQNSNSLVISQVKRRRKVYVCQPGKLHFVWLL